MKLNILCVGDVVGRPGRRVLADRLRHLVEDKQIDCVIVNAENAAGGSGLTPQIYDKLLKYGVNLVTLGDHAYRKRDIIPVLENSDRIARPMNLSAHAAGRGYASYRTSQGPVVAVAVLIGRLFMKPADCPYEAADRLVGTLNQQADIVLVEMHAEATSEKIAMGWHLDGRVSAVYGTHTHVATADERILPGGAAYITDLGMTGAHDSVIGRAKENVIKSFRTQMPYPFGVATEDVRINGVLMTVDSNTKRAEHIERIRVDAETTGETGYDSDDGSPEYLSQF